MDSPCAMIARRCAVGRLPQFLHWRDDWIDLLHVVRAGRSGRNSALIDLKRENKGFLHVVGRSRGTRCTTLYNDASAGHV